MVDERRWIGLKQVTTIRISLLIFNLNFKSICNLYSVYSEHSQVTERV